MAGHPHEFIFWWVLTPKTGVFCWGWQFLYVIYHISIQSCIFLLYIIYYWLPLRLASLGGLWRPVLWGWGINYILHRTTKNEQITSNVFQIEVGSPKSIVQSLIQKQCIFLTDLRFMIAWRTSTTMEEKVGCQHQDDQWSRWMSRRPNDNCG